ncbi:MAG: ABC transporter ATP-binding protein [Chloroflexi bacterium]|nr:ABC transporter ATP-binding protein [Chloroflexota bacterium]
MPVLQADSLVKVYARNGEQLRAVDGISFHVDEGEIFSLLGPNGAGKSTTIGMISGLIAPTEGTATIGGHSITAEPVHAKELMGVVPQEIALYPNLTARQNLAFFGRMYGMGGAGLDKRIDEVLEFIDLVDRQNDRIDTFSGGMKRRVNIGVGLLHKPKLVYMDEPTVGVDPQSRRRILDTVLRLRDEYKMAVLYTTHLMEESQEISDRVGIIDNGRLIAVGTVEALIQQVGEEDRLVIQVDGDEVPSSLVEMIKQREDVSDLRIEHREVEGSLTKGTQLIVLVRGGRRALPALLQLVDDAGVTVSSVEVREPDLEAVFLHLTGKALRD